MILPTVLISGFPTSVLVDRYAVPPKTVWELRDFLKPKPEQVRALVPHPDDYLNFPNTTDRILPLTPFPSVYQKLFLTLKQHTRIYPFAYDWRMPLEQTEQKLDDFINVILNDANRAGNADASHSKLKFDKVNLIGHSMGGLLTAGYVASTVAAEGLKPAFENKINKAITLGAPFAGSTEVVWRMTKGLRAHRHSLQLVPAAYHLLPEETLCGIDLFDAQNWSSQVTQALREYRQKTQCQEDLCEFFLRSGREYRKKFQRLRQDSTPWLAVVGVGEGTRTRISLSSEQGGEKHFNFSATTQEGDGYVVKASALPTFLKKEKLQSLQVAITDLEANEFVMRLFNALPKSWQSHLHLHTCLPGMNVVRRAIIKFLQEVRTQ